MNVENAFAKISDADIIALPTEQLPELETGDCNYARSSFRSFD